MKNNTSYTSKVVDDILTSVPEDEAYRIESRMLLAAKIEDAMTAAGYNKSRFAELMDKRPSEITKWLSGTHNFTADTLLDIQRKLKVCILNLENKKVEEIATYKATASSYASNPLTDGRNAIDFQKYYLSTSCSK